MYADTYEPIDYCIDAHFAGHSPDFLITPSTDPELYLNIRIHTEYTLQIWGQLHTPHNLPLYGVAVELFEVRAVQNHFSFISLGLTHTDCNGFYLFNVSRELVWCYKVAVYNKNPIHNQILSPAVNPCCQQQTNSCDSAFTHYIQQHLSTLNSNLLPSFRDTTPFTTIYVACQYA